MSKLSWPLERNHSKSWNSFMSCIYSNAIEVMKPGIVFYFIKTLEKKSCKTWVYEVYLGHECSLFTLYNCWFWIDELLTDWRCLAVLSPQTATISIIISCRQAIMSLCEMFGLMIRLAISKPRYTVLIFNMFIAKIRVSKCPIWKFLWYLPLSLLYKTAVCISFEWKTPIAVTFRM